MAFTRYWYDQSCMAYSIQTGGRKGSRLLPKDRAIVLHQGGECRWVGGMKRWLIRAQQPRRKRISCKGQGIPEGEPIPQHRDTTIVFVFFPVPALFIRHDLGGGQAHRGRAHHALRPVPPGQRANGAPYPPRGTPKCVYIYIYILVPGRRLSHTC